MTIAELNKFKAFALFNNNGHKNGFKNIAFAGNKIINTPFTSAKSQFVFFNYDFKNQIEKFTCKNNSPLKFDDFYCFEADHKFTLETIDLAFLPRQEKVNDLKISALVTKQKYIEQVVQLKKHIQQGDIYEINYCIIFEVLNAKINPLVIYAKLNSISKAPYSALVKLDDKYIISSSPELFLSKTGNTLNTKPIKGTARRCVDKAEDEKIKTDLQNNLKERTENVMIVDVARNDLSRLAKKGTVKVDSLYNIESYEQVHQMVSKVSCELKENTSLKDIIHATFPMASMTGAPKIRAMQLIDMFEHYNRGPFSGCVGYIDEDGDFDLNVLIRSIFYNQTEKYLSFSVGSAITAMCDPEKEYEECLLKAAALIKALEN